MGFIFITVGEPARDNKNAGDLYKILTSHGWDENNIYYLKENKSMDLSGFEPEASSMPRRRSSELIYKPTERH